jgi:hypothetical protein
VRPITGAGAGVLATGRDDGAQPSADATTMSTTGKDEYRIMGIGELGVRASPQGTYVRHCARCASLSPEQQARDTAAREARRNREGPSGH